MNTHKKCFCPPFPPEPVSLPYSHHQYDEIYPDIGEPLELAISSKGGHFAPPKYGISLSIPPNAIPSEMVQNIFIRPCVSGPFKYPEGYEPFSAVYLIMSKPQKVELSLEQKVELRLDHYAQLETDEQANQMTFMSATVPKKDSGNKVVEFKPMNGGKFTVHERYGALMVEHFCYITICGTKISNTSKQSWYSTERLFLCTMKVV